MRWVYLSPHFDDAVLSCGGMIAEQVRSGDEVEIWTICAGNPPSGQALSEFASKQHKGWGVSGPVASLRRVEDEAACRIVGATPHFWTLPDCIYRRLPSGEALVHDEAGLWVPVHPAERAVQRQMAAWLRKHLRAEMRVVCPLSLGNHVDHRLVRATAETLGRTLYYYADFPYAAQHSLMPPLGVAQEDLYQIGISEDALAIWQAGSEAYASQIETLFGTVESMRAQIADFWQHDGGSFLWESKTASPS
jgi:LmbE family N-acetylglucosaminyl deacetylase